MADAVKSCQKQGDAFRKSNKGSKWSDPRECRWAEESSGASPQIHECGNTYILPLFDCRNASFCREIGW